MSEAPGAAALTGGVIVLTAVIANEAFAAWWAARNGSAATNASPAVTPGP